jgi:hypothetical protein
MEFSPDVYNGSLAYRARLECPNEGYTPTGLPWREGGLANSTTVTIMSKDQCLSTVAFPPFDGLLIDAVLNVTFRCRYSISVGHLSGRLSLSRKCARFALPTRSWRSSSARSRCLCS